MSGIDEWWSLGERVPLHLGARERDIFVRHMGAGPTMTLLHGFPSSSHDWAKLAPMLAEHHALLLADFLGFGASEKPADHDYSLHEQADLLEALWAREGVSSTILVAHDYAVSVAQARPHSIWPLPRLAPPSSCRSPFQRGGSAGWR